MRVQPDGNKLLYYNIVADTFRSKINLATRGYFNVRGLILI